MELLRREPGPHHVALYQRIKALIMSDSACDLGNVPSAGRKFPELNARVAELSDFLTKHGCTPNVYDKSFAGVELPGITKDDPALEPYHDLDPAKIKLHGRGEWDPTEFLSDNLRVAFREPSVLLHGQITDPGPIIRDSAETVATLAKKWDDQGLLVLHRTPVHKDAPVRIFGAYKDANTHRQIGDRRGQNAREARLLGPSRDLPSGCDFCEIYVDPKISSLRISVSDRRDFYHQLKSTYSKAIANTVGPAIPTHLVEDAQAYAVFLLRSSKTRRDRSKYGDELGQRPILSDDFVHLGEGECWVAFGSMLQGDHAGVEVATEAHVGMLQSEGTLREDHRMKASKPLFSSDQVEGLVIDDYFCLSVQPKDIPGCQTKAFEMHQKASSAYSKHNLLGSPHKDVIAADEGRVIGAYLNASDRATKNGLVTLGAPIAKRLALSYLSLQICQLPCTSDMLHLCLIGGWVSVIGYRRPLMSILNDSFRVVNIDQYSNFTAKLVPLSRAVANELCLLAVLIPLAQSELNAPFSDRIFCTDASNTKGAILSAQVPRPVSEVLWKTSRTKGAYSRLLSPVEAALKQLGELQEEDACVERPKPQRPLAFCFEFVEIYAGAAKVSKLMDGMGVIVGPPIDLSESPEFDMAGSHIIEWLTFLVSERKLLGFLLGPPCTTFSIMRRPRLRSREFPLGFNPSDAQTWMGNRLSQRACQLMTVGSRNSSCGLLETPYSSYMKHTPGWQKVRDLPQTEEVRCDSCQYGSPHQKSFRLLGLRLNVEKLQRRCSCLNGHLRVEGTLTKHSATYTDELAQNMAETFATAIQFIKSTILDFAEGETKGLECQLTNDIAMSAPWKLEKVWSFKRNSHINTLEESSVLRLCTMLAKGGTPIRACNLADSNVVRCATSKGRSSSFGLSPVLRRVSATCVAGGIYLSVPFVPTRLNASDDPTRDRPIRSPAPSLGVFDMTTDNLFKLAGVMKTRRWASNWVRLIIKICGIRVLDLTDRATHRQTDPFPRIPGFETALDFDCTLGYPGEGPLLAFMILILVFEKNLAAAIFIGPSLVVGI